MTDKELAKAKRDKIQEIQKIGCEALLNTIFTDDLKKTYTLEQAKNDKGKFVQSALVKYKIQNGDWIFLTIKYSKPNKKIFELKKIADFTKENELEESLKLFEKMKFEAHYWKNGYEHEFVKVEGGEYELSPEDEDDNKPYKVKVDSFYIAKYQVTQELYKSVIGENPSKFKGELQPVEQVTWYDAVEFCNKLSEKEGLESCYKIDIKNVECDFTKNGYRLPTEAEWEIAAKGGENYKYSGSDDLNEVGWYCGNSGGKTHEVGQKKANGYGLYDTSGNVSEWCWNWYSREVEGGENTTGAAPVPTCRGGTWDSWDYFCSFGFRSSSGSNPYHRRHNLGFRLCRSVW